MIDMKNIFTPIILLIHLDGVILLTYILFITRFSLYYAKHLFTSAK